MYPSSKTSAMNGDNSCKRQRCDSPGERTLRAFDALFEGPHDGSDYDKNETLAVYMLDKRLLENFKVAKATQDHSKFLNSQPKNVVDNLRDHSSPGNPPVKQHRDHFSLPDPNYGRPSNDKLHVEGPNMTSVLGRRNVYEAQSSYAQSGKQALPKIPLNPNIYGNFSSSNSGSSSSAQERDRSNSSQYASSPSYAGRRYASPVAAPRDRKGTLPEDAYLQPSTYEKSKVDWVNLRPL